MAESRRMAPQRMSRRRNKNTKEEGLTGLIKSEVEMPNNFFGLKFEYKSARDSETLHSDQSADYRFSLKYTNEETKPLTIATKFDKVEYEEMVNEYYAYYSPDISRQSFKKTIVDKLRRRNSQSELTDFLGLEAIEFIHYIFENRDSIVQIDEPVITQSEEEEQYWKDTEKMDKKLNKTSDERQKKKKSH